MSTQGIDISGGLVSKAADPTMDISSGLVAKDAPDFSKGLVEKSSQALGAVGNLNPGKFAPEDQSAARLTLGAPPTQAQSAAEQAFQVAAENNRGAAGSSTPLRLAQPRTNLPSAGPIVTGPTQLLPVATHANLARSAQDDPIGYQTGDDRPEGSLWMPENTLLQRDIESPYANSVTHPLLDRASEATKAMVRDSQNALEGSPNIFEFAAKHPEQVAGNAVFPGVGDMLRGGEELQTEGQRARGAVRVAGGATDALMSSATAAFFEAPVHLAAGLAAGTVAQQVGPVRHLAAAAGADEDTQRAASEVDFWLPTVLGSLVGLKAGSRERPVYDADGELLGSVKVHAAAAADGRVGAVVESTPNEHKFGVKLGDREYTISVPRSRNSEPDDPQLQEPGPRTANEAEPSQPSGPSSLVQDILSRRGQDQNPSSNNEPPVAHPSAAPPVPSDAPRVELTADGVPADSPAAKALQTLRDSGAQDARVYMHANHNWALSASEQVNGGAGTLISFHANGLDSTISRPASDLDTPEKVRNVVDEVRARFAGSDQGTIAGAQKRIQAIENPATNDTASFHQALQEVGGGKLFGELTPGDQSRVLMRAQELKLAGSKLAKGDSVRLPDGREGTLKFTHPAMQLSRVLLPEGGSVQVGPKSLQRVESNPPEPGSVGIMSTKAINADPNRFQYKLATDAEGVSPLLKNSFRWNPELAGVVGVWKDPADGRTYVVNGHHRLELARRTDTKQLAVRHIVAQSASEARAIGALTNIAEGRGTALDAAKFMRETGTSAEELEHHGVSMGEATARDGAALAGLDDSLFNRVAQGEMPQSRGVAIAQATNDHAEQKALASLVDRQEVKGKRVTNDAIRELSGFVRGAGKQTETTSSLFGDIDVERSLALEKAEVSAYVKQQLARDRKLFGFVSHEGRAAELSRAGNDIKTSENKRIATSAAQAEAVYDKLKNSAGPVSDALQSAAQKLAAGENANGVKQEAYNAVKRAVAQTLTGTESAGAEGSGEAAKRRADLSGQQFSQAPPQLPAVTGSTVLQSEGSEGLHPIEASLRALRTSIDPASTHYPVIRINPEGTAFVGAVLSEPPGWSGLSMSLKAVRDAAAFLDRLITSNETPRYGLAQARELSTNLKAALATARQNGIKRIAFVVDDHELETSTRHEQFHSWSAENPGIDQAIDELYRDPTSEKAIENVLGPQFQYPDVPSVMVEEIGAFIASGDHASIGLSEDEAARWFTRFLQLTANKLKNAPPMAASLAGRLGAMKGIENVEQNLGGTARQNGAGVQAKINGPQRDSERSQANGGGDRPDRKQLAQLARGGERTRGSSGTVRPGEAGGIAETESVKHRRRLPDNAVGKLLTEKIENVQRAKDLDRALAELGPQYDADVLRGVKIMKAAPGTPADEEAVYHHIENPSEPLTDTQRELYQEWVKPLLDASTDIYNRLSENNVSAEGYVHRVVKGENSLIDRVLSGSKAPSGGNRLSKYAASTKSRTMMALEPENGSGNRQVVSISGDKVTQYRNGKATELGRLSSGLTTWWHVQDARLESLAKQIGELEKKINDLPQQDRDEQVAKIDAKLKELHKQRDLLMSVKGRGRSQHGAVGISITFNQRKRLTEQIDALEKEREEISGASGNAKLSRSAEERARKLRESMTVLKNQRARILEQVPTDKLAKRIWMDASGKKWTITQATTKEIEAHTNVRYYHNALASAVTNYLSLRKAERALDFLNNLKASPDFAAIGLKHGEGRAPEGWRPTTLPQLQGYRFELHIADVLDRFSSEIGKRGPNLLEKVNNFLRTSIFFNPLIHVPNLAVHAAVEKGITGWMPHNWPRTVRANLRAINAVTHTNADYLEALDSGAPLQYHRFEGKQLTDVFFKKLVGEMEQDHGFGEKLASALGYANPAKLIRAIYDFSGHVTWWTNDVSFLQSAYEKVERGMSLTDALRETGKHIPEYRIPTHVMGSSTLGTIMRHPLATMFGSYHYSALRSYGEMVKDALGADRSTKDRGHAFDVLAMLGLMTMVIYPLADALIQKALKDKDAHFTRAGAATFPYNMYLLAKGEKSPREAAESVMTPSVVAKAGAELATNRDWRTGRAIYDPHADAQTLAWQLAHKGSEYVAPISSVQRATGDSERSKRAALGLIGIHFRKNGAEKVAQDIAAGKASKEAPTPESADRAAKLATLHREAERGNLAPTQEALRKHEISGQQFHEIVESSRNELMETVKNFSYEELKRVFDAATPEQQKQLEPMLRRKQVQENRKPTSSGLPHFLRTLTPSK